MLKCVKKKQFIICGQGNTHKNQILLKLIAENIQSVLHGYELSKRMTDWKLNIVNTQVHKNKVVYGILKLSAPSWKKENIKIFYCCVFQTDLRK